MSAAHRYSTGRPAPAVVCVIAIGVLAGCAPGSDQAPIEDAAMAEEPVASEQVAERATAILAPFKSQLMAALGAALARSPVEAIQVCRLQAPAIATNLSSNNVRLGRSSERLRNPANAPSEWVQGVLAEYAGMDEWTPQVVDLADGRFGYVEPIVAQPQCLACHGDSIAPDIQAAIDRDYPEDRAIGYAAGDLRGVFWVELTRDAVL